MNGNSVQNIGEPGIGQITVHLYEDENLDGVITPGVDAHVGVTTSGADGSYQFSGLSAGNYQIIVDQNDEDFPAQVVCTADPQGAKDGRSSFELSVSRNDQNFGFQPYGFNTLGDTVFLDLDLNKVQSGYSEFGIPSIPVTLELDLSGNGDYATYATAVTDANGRYLFSQLPDGNYRVSVNPNSSGLPRDPFNVVYTPTTQTAYEVGLSGGESRLDADFGFAPLCAIGDTVYWDYNANGGQDWTEPGIPGVTVRLYADANGNRFYDDGEELLDTRVTDDLGRYTFTGLFPGDYVVVVDPDSSPLAGATLTADPDLDGAPCPVPPTDVCDGAYGTSLLSGNAFTGADFGYCPAGGMIGDTLWIDLNTNGVREAEERGIPAITVQLYTNDVLVATSVTDIDGMYLFTGLPDATYRVTVLTSDPDFPAGLSACYDADGTPDGDTAGIVISGGHITQINGRTVTDADLTIDFGYAWTGNNKLSGTVGMDDATKDGLLNGMNPSGTGAGEYPFARVPVYVHLWRDDGDNVVEAGETELVASASTDANGDYAFSNLPNAVGTHDRYLVTLTAPAEALRLTTKTDDTPALWVDSTSNNSGWTLSARQAVAIAPSTENIDFAFETTVLRDFGDLPSSYGTTVADSPTGPRQYVNVVPDLYLGAGVDTEPDGQPSPDATGDGDDEDGVVVKGRWTDGGNSGHIEVTVGAGSGWLIGYIDFNQDGAFTNINERIVDQAVDSEGTGVVYALSFPIPEGTFRTNEVTVLNARFRLLDRQPVLGVLGSDANNSYGEVEDYQFVFGAIGDRTWHDVNGNGLQDAGETALTNVTVQIFGADDTLLGTEVTDADGRYLFTGLPAGTYYLTFSAPTNYVPTAQQVGTDQSLDSDIDPQTGRSAPISLVAGAMEMNRAVDAGFYAPANVHGYVFEDKDDNGLFYGQDTAITSVLVRLAVGGVVTNSTSTDSTGHYVFTNVPPGKITLQVSFQEGAELAEEPATEPGASDPRRTRASLSSDESYAYIEHDVISGQGTLAGTPYETLNFGFLEYPLSTAIDIRLHATAEGVMIHLWTVNEAEWGYRDIEIYAWIDNDWIKVGYVPSDSLIGGGGLGGFYSVAADGLAAGGAYYLKVIDEVGNVHLSPTPVAVETLLVDAVRLDLQCVTLRFNTEQGRCYQVEVSTDLVNWVPEYVNAPTAKGDGPEFVMEFTAGPGTHTEVRVPRKERTRAFFRIRRVE